MSRSVIVMYGFGGRTGTRRDDQIQDHGGVPPRQPDGAGSGQAGRQRGSIHLLSSRQNIQPSMIGRKIPVLYVQYTAAVARVGDLHIHVFCMYCTVQYLRHPIVSEGLSFERLAATQVCRCVSPILLRNVLGQQISIRSILHTRMD